MGVVQIRVTPKTRSSFTIKALSISGVTWNWHVLNHAHFCAKPCASLVAPGSPLPKLAQSGFGAQHCVAIIVPKHRMHRQINPLRLSLKLRVDHSGAESLDQALAHRLGQPGRADDATLCTAGGIDTK